MSASRTIDRVTDALVQSVRDWIKLPTKREAELTKRKFDSMQGLPSVIGCVDGTHVRIQAPIEEEHEYVNIIFFHSINVQVRRLGVFISFFGIPLFLLFNNINSVGQYEIDS